MGRRGGPGYPPPPPQKTAAEAQRHPGEGIAGRGGGEEVGRGKGRSSRSTSGIQE